MRFLFRRTDGTPLNVDRDVWLCALDLAVRGGWKPRGVDLALAPDRMEPRVAYFPPRGQRVSRDDALDIGVALQAALSYVSDRIVSRKGGAFGERNTLDLLRQAASGGPVSLEKTEAALEVLSGPPKAEAARLADFLKGGGFTLHARGFGGEEESLRIA